MRKSLALAFVISVNSVEKMISNRKGRNGLRKVREAGMWTPVFAYSGSHI